MTVDRLARVTLVLVGFSLAAASRLDAVATQPRFDLSAVTNAHYRTRHLIGTGMASPNTLPAKRAEIESNLRILEAVEPTRAVAAQYRQSIVKVEEGVRHFERAKRSTGKTRSQFFDLGNAAFGAAKDLIDAAVRIFNQVLPQLQRMFAPKGRPVLPPPPGELPMTLTGHFRDCLEGTRGSDLQCCTHNFRAGMFLLNYDKYVDLWTPKEWACIKKCLDEALRDCKRDFLIHDERFEKRRWEECFKKFFIFEYPP